MQSIAIVLVALSLLSLDAFYLPSPTLVLLARMPLLQYTSKVQSTGEVQSEVRTPWLIVGGGIHGVTIAARLLSQGIVTDAEKIYIVDPHPKLLHSWKARTAATGMGHLRSSVGYHLDLPVDSLKRFGLKNTNGAPPFANDFKRPTLNIFNEHCDNVVEKYNLGSRHRKGTVTAIEPSHDEVCVSVSSEISTNARITTYIASKLVLALGNDSPAYPDWVSQDDIDAQTVQHLFDLENQLETTTTHKTDVAIIGAGISAAHKALELIERPEQTPVHIISRHPVREAKFDTHQDYMVDGAAARRSAAKGGEGVPKLQRRFVETSSLEDRRRIIIRER